MLPRALREVTKDERKILDDAPEGRLKMASRRRWLLPVVVIGLICAATMMVEGLKTLASGKVIHTLPPSYCSCLYGGVL